MADKPILYSGPMVLAVLDDRKIKTRRVVTPRSLAIRDLFFDDWTDSFILDDGNREGREKAYPWYVGDTLWVREGIEWNEKGKLVYSADQVEVGTSDAPDDYDAGRQTRLPSMFMPRWACRIRLEVTDMRVERLQDITLNDIRAEGIGKDVPDQFLISEWIKLWDGLNGDRKKEVNGKVYKFDWESNPWVTVTTFRKVEA